MNHTHQFQSQVGRDLFALVYELTTEAHPCGQFHSFTDKPTTLPTAKPSEIALELGRVAQIRKGEFRGTPSSL